MVAFVRLVLQNILACWDILKNIQITEPVIKGHLATAKATYFMTLTTVKGLHNLTISLGFAVK